MKMIEEKAISIVSFLDSAKELGIADGSIADRDDKILIGLCKEYFGEESGEPLYLFLVEKTYDETFENQIKAI